MLKGSITPIIKDKKVNISKSENYRPIMQSSCLLKLFEIILLNVLSDKIKINDRQFGFRKGMSTTDCCFLLKEIMYKYSRPDKSGIVTFVDFSKAFDRVDHFVLGFKLLRHGVPCDIIYILMHYLRNQLAKVTWKGVSGAFHYVEKGVRQGGILSPFLFNIYINEIINEVSSMNVGCTLGINRCNMLVYADDVALIAGSVEDMDIIYSKFCTLVNEHKLLINKAKTKCFLFSRRRIQDNIDVVHLDNDRLEVVKSFKYLGHLISSNFEDSYDINFRLRKFYASFNSIKRDFTHVSLDTLIFLFNSYCKPDFGLPLWSNSITLKSCAFKTFNVAYNKAMKKMIGAPVYSSSHESANACNLLLLNHHVTLLQCRYTKRLEKSRNSLIRNSMPFLKSGYFYTNIYRRMKDIYSIDITIEGMDVITSRIYWMQSHEERRVPVHYVR